MRGATVALDALTCKEFHLELRWRPTLTALLLLQLQTCRCQKSGQELSLGSRIGDIDHQVRCGVRREVGACLERVRIVGGSEAGCNEWPWQVHLDRPIHSRQGWGDHRYLYKVGLLSRNGWEINSDPFCGGALVNSRHIVTAAHCTHGKTVAQIAVTVIVAESVSGVVFFLVRSGTTTLQQLLWSLNRLGPA